MKLQHLQQELRELRGIQQRYPTGADPEYISWLILEGKTQAEIKQILAELREEGERRARLLKENIKRELQDKVVGAFLEVCDPHNRNYPHLLAGCWDVILDPYLDEGHNLPSLHFGDRFSSDWAVIFQNYDNLLMAIAPEWRFLDCVLWAYGTVLASEAVLGKRRYARHKKMAETLLEYGG